MKRSSGLLSMILFFFIARSLLAADVVSILVFPPENLSGSPALSWIGEGLCVSLTEQLRVPGATVFTREERLSFVEGADLPPNATLSRASMIHIAQHVGADKLAMGSYSGTADNLRISLRVLDLKTLKLGGEIVSSGPLVALPQMENELSWIIVSDAGLNKSFSREEFRSRTRTVLNSAFALFIQSLGYTDPEEQVKLLRRAVEIHSDFPDAQYRLGRYFYQQGNCAETIRHLLLAGNHRHTHVEDQFIIGNCYLKQNDYTSAIHAYSTAESFAKSAQTLNNSGVANLLKGDYTLAAQCLVEARDIARTDPTIGLNLAIVRHLQGNDDAAHELLEEMERVHPNVGMIPFLLSIVLNTQGDGEGAAKALAQAQRLGIDSEKLRNENPKTWARIFNSWDNGP